MCLRAFAARFLAFAARAFLESTGIFFVRRRATMGVVENSRRSTGRCTNSDQNDSNKEILTGLRIERQHCRQSSPRVDDILHQLPNPELENFKSKAAVGKCVGK